jgi:1,4-dihydroxy-2-naphthoate octaprenyltransferase
MHALKHWLLAARPKTLPAAIAPVLVGSALAQRHGGFQWVPMAFCILFALLIQIATNFANDYFDFKKGTDNANRRGPKRAVAQGWITPKAMLFATFITLGLSILVGLNLVYFGGYHLTIVGLLSVLMAILYTGGPYPLAYLGLGDLFVLIFFGWVAVLYTYRVQVGAFDWSAFHIGTAVGMLSVNLLLVNNYRDHENDRVCNKRTTVVRFGTGWGRLQHRLATIVAGLSLAWIGIVEKTVWVIIPIAIVQLGWFVSFRLKTAGSETAFDTCLKMSALILVLFSISGSLVLIRF